MGCCRNHDATSRFRQYTTRSYAHGFTFGDTQCTPMQAGARRIKEFLMNTERFGAVCSLGLRSSETAATAVWAVRCTVIKQ
jgi:hypothetical protein